MKTANQSTSLIDARTTNGDGEVVRFPPHKPSRTHQARVVGTGALTATFTFYGSNGETGPWAQIGAIALSGATDQSESFVSDAAWMYEYCVLSALTGTGATANASVGM